ncbi:MAG: putative DNA binding domain-containing protein [Caldisericia bacterium]|nr:putative DNA binding domain-containing protein [Caldisericia bacterium]
MDFSESSLVELKQQIVSDIRKTIVAFANTAGGTIYIGIDDDGIVVGIAKPDEEMLQVSNMIRDAIRPDITMFVSCKKENIKGKNVIKVSVQRGTECPYYLTKKGLKPSGVYVRQGTSSVPASEFAIRMMIKESDGDKFEAVRSLDQNLTFTEAAQEFLKRRVSFGINQYTALKIVNSDGLYTNLGLLLSDQCVHSIKMAVFDGISKSTFIDRREFNGSLLRQMNETYDYISQHNKIKAEFSGLVRIDQRDYPEEALREVLLNSIVHRDHSYSASILVSLFNDRMEFVSVGGLLKGISLKDIMLGISFSRNENLASVFYRLKLIEAYGTGMSKIFNSYDNCAVKPNVEVSDNAFKFTLPNRNFVGKKNLLTDQEKIIIEQLSKKTKMTRMEVQSVLGISQTMSGLLLKKLINSGHVNVEGKGKSTKYFLKKQI